jgi:perosamine synthetase
MRIPLSAPDVTEADIAAVTQVLRGTRLSLGGELERFERAVADFAGVAHGVAMNSGTSALHVLLRGIGIGPGDEVIVPSFAFVAVANVVRYVDAVPVFVEIDRRMLTLDPAEVEKAITGKTRAILAVHTFGCPADMHALGEIARENRLLLIEDACEAIGAEYKGEKVGALGVAGAFAFYPNKQITTGEGGLLVTNDAELAASARALRNQGRHNSRDWFQHEELGYSYRLPEMNCALGAEQMKRMESILSRREEVAGSYERRLRGNPDLELPASEIPDRRISWFAYVVRLSERFTRADRDRLVEEMGARGIECGRYFAPIHLQPAYSETVCRRGDLSLTESIADRSLALPFFNRMTEEQIGEVCDTLAELLSRTVSRLAASENH